MLELTLVLLIICCLSVAAFFEGTETAVISTNRMRFRTLSEQGNRRASIVVQLLEKPGKLLGVTLIGGSLFSVAATALSAVLIRTIFVHIVSEARIEDYVTLRDVINTAIMTLILLVFAQIIPKAVGRSRANSISLAASIPMKFASMVLYPLAFPIVKVGTGIARLFGRSNVQNDSTAMEELKILAKLGESHGAIRPQQSKMISSVFDLRKQTISRVMVPLVDIVSVEKNLSIKEFYDRISRTRYSRFPVYSGRTDNIVGIVNVLDVIYSEEKTGTIRQFVHEDVVYLPETKQITSSLQELQKSSNPMGIVVDEYGGVVGIVTLEDIVTEIIGEMKDDLEERKPSFDGTTLECDGRMEIDEINELLGTDIPSEDYDTIAGFVISQMDKIPKPLEETRWKNIRIIVIRSTKRSILRVKLMIEEEENNEEIETRDTEG
jgi:putative hemolysin